MAADFKSTLNIENRIKFNDDTRQMMLMHNNRIFSYDSLKGYAKEEENRSPKGLARAFSLGGLFMAQDERNVSALNIRLQFEEGEEFIKLVVTPTRSSTVFFKKLDSIADRIMEKLRAIQPENALQEGSGVHGTGTSYSVEKPAQDDYTEEIRRLHGLMEDGIITEEEFRQKKKQLLGL